MTFGIGGFTACYDSLDHSLSVHWHSQTLRRLHRWGLPHHLRAVKTQLSVLKARERPAFAPSPGNEPCLALGAGGSRERIAASISLSASYGRKVGSTPDGQP